MSNDPVSESDVWVRRMNAARAIVREVAVIIAACASTTAMVVGYLNHQGSTEHTQQLSEIRTVVDDKAATIDKTAQKVEEVKAAVVKPP